MYRRPPTTAEATSAPTLGAFASERHRRVEMGGAIGLDEPIVGIEIVGAGVLARGLLVQDKSTAQTDAVKNLIQDLFQIIA
jgi:hypothetical protein